MPLLSRCTGKDWIMSFQRATLSAPPPSASSSRRGQLKRAVLDRLLSHLWFPGNICWQLDRDLVRSDMTADSLISAGRTYHKDVTDIIIQIRWKGSSRWPQMHFIKQMRAIHACAQHQELDRNHLVMCINTARSRRSLRSMVANFWQRRKSTIFVSLFHITTFDILYYDIWYCILRHLIFEDCEFFHNHFL